MFFSIKQYKKIIIYFLATIFLLIGLNYISFARAENKTLHNGIEANITSASELVESAKKLYQTEKYREAIAQLTLARAEYRAQQNNLQEAMVLNNIALAYQQLRDYQAIEANLKDSFNLITKLESSPEQQLLLAQAYDLKGKLYLTKGQTNLAWESWSQAAINYDEVNNTQGVIRSRINQAQALQILGYYRRAVTTLTSIQTQLETQPDTITKAVSLRSLGNALFAVGELELARSNLEASLKIAESLSDKAEMSFVFLGLGNIAKVQNETEKAIAFYQKSVNTAPQTINKVQAHLNLLNLLIASEGDYRAELTVLNSSIPQLPLNRSAIYAQINYAQNLLKTDSFPGNRQQIIKILNEAIENSQTLEDKYTEAYGLKNLGRLYELSDRIPQAQQATQQFLILAQELNARDLVYQGHWQLGRIYKTQNKLQQATISYQLAVETLQSLRSDLIAVNPETQFAFRESIEPIYREYVDLLLSPKVKETNLIAARDAIDSLQLAELENFFRATCLDAETVNIDRIIEQSDPTAAIVYPIVLEDRFEIIIKLPQQQLRRYSTPIDNPARAERIIQRLSQSLTQRNSRETLDLAQQVYSWLIEPASVDLAESEVKTLVFVLDSPLRNIPMSVLHDGQQYLIEKYSIAIAPGLQLVQPQRLSENELTALTAGVTEARGGFPPLQYVAQELNTIQTQIADTQKLLDSNFTRAALQEKIEQVPFPIVHLATHGQFSSQAEETFLLTWDGRINVNQLNNLLRNSNRDRESAIELLVLSACETLTGDKRAALGLAGVAVRAGARSTLATLWRVNDEGTAALMGQFYRELASSQDYLSKAEALRRAQLSLLKSDRFERPHFWASYVLVGNWL